jgi:ammonia channel protein AmtB
MERRLWRAILVWTLMDKMAYGKPSVLGAVNGMIAGLVAITPGAGYVDGIGAIIIGIVAGIIPWMAMNWLQKTSFMMRVDDTLSVFSTHGVAGLTGGLLVGVLANPGMMRHARLLASLTEAELKQAISRAHVSGAVDRAVNREVRRIIRARR